MTMFAWSYPLLCLQKAKNSTFAIKRKNGAMDLKLCLQTQLDSSNNMGWDPSGHTSAHKAKKMPKIVQL